MEDLPLDFTSYLSMRLGLTSEQAADLLRAWLEDYEPVSCRTLNAHRPTKSMETSSHEELQRTG
jgi:hypothetical protein